MKAKLVKETEKAIQLTYCVQIYGDQFTIKNVWFPKSQLEILYNDGKVIEFIPKNDWILNAKTKEYCKYVESIVNVSTEIKCYLSPAGGDFVVDYCWC